MPLSEVDAIKYKQNLVIYCRRQKQRILKKMGQTEPVLQKSSQVDYQA